MISAQEIAISLRGAGRLALRDPGGFAYFDASIEGFWRSFGAAALIFPVYLLMIATRADSDPAAINGVAALLIETIAYVIDWVAFPLAMFHVTAMIDRAERYIPYIVAVNWCNLVQVALFGAILLLRLTGLLPDGLIEFLWLVVLLWVLSYQWFVARTALDVGGLAAAGIVALSFFLSLFIQAIAYRIHGA